MLALQCVVQETLRLAEEQVKRALDDNLGIIFIISPLEDVFLVLIGIFVVPNVLSPRDLVFRPDIMDETVKSSLEFLVWVEALRPSQQFFIHVATEPPLPGYYQYFFGR